MYEGRVNGEEYVKLHVYSPPDQTRPLFKEATTHKFRKCHLGESFGPSWSTHWFRVELKIPDFWKHKERLEFTWDANNEGMIYHENGDIVHGLTGGGERSEWILPEDWRDDKWHTFYVEMACNGMFGNASGDMIQPPRPDRYYRLWQADIIAVNLDARQLDIDFWEISDAAREFPENSWEQHKALMLCNKIIDTFIAGEGNRDTLKKCRKLAEEYVGDTNSHKIYENGKQELITAVGNCHIDTCWLWPWAETKRKVARSYANQCDLLDRYPEMRFVASQAQQWKWLKTDYPGLWDRVKEHVKKGNFAPIGGSWVEHDTNMPSGESLSRQFLYGQRFFEGNFGKRCETFWLPDTFGYSPQIPQVCRQAGMTRFFTQKLSWNNINNFPHTTFNWVALDGSQVLCHMTPAETYTAGANFGDIKRSITQHKSMDQNPKSLLMFGKGDGGGGPTFQMVEKLRRLRGMADTTGLIPRVKLGNTVDEFFDDLQKSAAEGTDYVTWYGELYFELHRGTYTTQSNNKRNNRRAEFLLRDLEWLATLASIKDTVSGKGSKKYTYPKKEIDFMWEGVLLCHFHDCLPGSSIEMCYDDSNKLYAEVFDKGEKAINDALTHLGFDDKGNGELVCINSLPWDRREILEVRAESKPTEYVFAHPQSSGLGIPSSVPIPKLAFIREVSKDIYVMCNQRFTLQVSHGVITSLYDHDAKREVLTKGGKANQFVIFDDKPIYWQAWDVEVYHLESRAELQSTKSTVVESVPHQVSLVTETKISEKSWLKSTITLSSSMGGDDENMIKIDCEVEWRETMKFLKVEFPVDIVNTEATYEMQYGHIKRPTHYNTSWDMAKFEVCCHKWADLSEANYGVSILNDSKYGFATCGKLMRLSLLRSPKAPDEHADMGKLRSEPFLDCC